MEERRRGPLIARGVRGRAIGFSIPSPFDHPILEALQGPCCTIRSGILATEVRLRRSSRFHFAVALLGLCAASAAAAAAPSYSIGVGYHRPALRAVADRYGDGVAVEAGIEVRWRATLLSLEGGFQRSSAGLDAPFFMENAKGTLTGAPIDLVVRFPLGGSAPWSPYAGAGFELLWLRESFRYRLDGEDRENRPDGGFHPGGILVAGVDRNAFPRARLEGFLSMIPIRRMQSSLGSTYSPHGASRANGGAYGIRVAWRLP
jgi:hypothetical protein